MAIVKQDEGEELIIKPEAVTPSINTSEWPLLLRNWDQRKHPVLIWFEAKTLTPLSTRPHWSLHPHTRWLHTSAPRPQILHLVWRD
jgi:hypothetical protein